MAISAALHCARIACLLALVATAGGLGAQTRLYKSVGPDGRVTFSDKPPAAQDAVPFRPGAPAPSATAARTDAVAPLLVLNVEALSRPAAASRNPAAERSARLMMILGHQVMDTMQQCGTDFPDGRRKYGPAMDAWLARHKALSQRAYDVSRELLGETEHMLFLGAIIKAIDEGKSNYRYASPPAKLKWCDAQWQQIDGGRMDKLADTSVTGPLDSYPGEGQLRERHRRLPRS
jgi:hypothetical protein